MASPKAAKEGGERGVDPNLGVDYVVHYKIPENERAEAEASYVQLIEALTNVGLTSEVRPADDSSLLVFVKMASPDLLREQAFSSRLQDWLHGVRTSGPNASGDLATSLMEEPVSEAERLRLVYLAMVRTKEEGGAGITPGVGKWKYVASVFPLHDRKFNGAWITRLSTKYLLGNEDLDEIKDKFGEQVALYFAFVQAYFRALVFPAALGASTWFLLGSKFSFLYALGSCLWSVVFFEYWKKKEVDLAVQWGVRGVSKIQLPRVEFEADGEAEDVVTGEKVKVYSPFRRLGTQLLQIPFTVACVVVLGGFIATCNSLEIFITEVYTGPFGSILPFLPTVLLVTVLPAFSAVLTAFAKKLTDMENYETVDSYHAALVQKEFVLNFMTSYMPLAFTAFVYLPFGHLLTPYLDFWRAAAQMLTFGEKELSTQDFNINPDRITKQMFYFTVTAQIVNFGTEAIVPYVKRKLTKKAKERGIVGKVAEIGVKDTPEEASFLSKVRAEAELEMYDVTTDYREMVIQFGYLSLFSVAWPLAGCSFMINNWVELRSDAFKIATGSRRPIPWRADSIGPWLDALGFLSWLGSLTSPAIVYLCRGGASGSIGAASNVEAWGLLLTILLAEHFYLLVQMAVRVIMGKVDSPGLQRERRERFEMKKRMLGGKVPISGAIGSQGAVAMREKLAQSALHEEAGLGVQGSLEDR
ncbi:related to IST2 protein [Cephalotrichum gorgonifer]|uniref:Related to IST2 protein n=1 Tax=Cephalotrichum gorgonifer TaxID=2041049 RepID=A0AAE8STA9_9PEZI|nr:related to IST2 protein [Cephalotrichum gorgonifer]